MLRSVVVPATLAGLVLSAQADPLSIHRSPFWSGLDRDGDLTAGWVQVLPVLATACNLRLDNSQLTDKLMDLSRREGNVSYSRNLYLQLYNIETHRARNSFVQAWTARFDGHQDDACKTAETLWGTAGNQFPGVLKRDAAADLSGTPSP